MATLLPPRKRRKLYHGVPEPEIKSPPPVPNIVVQFVNEEDGEALAPAVNLPADLSREGLETLLNKLTSKVCTALSFFQPLSHNFFFLARQEEDPVPFAFHVTIPGSASGEEGNTLAAPTRIVVANSLQQDVLLNPKHPATPEDVFVVHCSPQAVFKVRPATRCSSTLTGELLSGSPKWGMC